ncbi:Autolytic lysozyme [Patescibacteria group bacterium]|nr:Autolytic lysozyme [Patescibacteria group bacterium]
MLLKVGSKGDNVKKVQAKLGLTADGIFGSNTQEAVKKWQVSQGLTADGIIGDVTWNKMFANVKDLDLTKLKGHVPDIVIAQIPACAEKFKINTALRLAHFLAQCGHESAGFKTTQENLNYSADGLNKIFGKYFKTVSAESYARQPEKIASRVYANRMGNGDEASKEGWKYRGRGYIQLTGKSNYTEFDKFVDDDIVENPDLVASNYALLSAAWYWNSRSLNTSADKGASDAVVTEITKKVNGGTIGLADRTKHFKEYYQLLA